MEDWRAGDEPEIPSAEEDEARRRIDLDPDDNDDEDFPAPPPELPLDDQDRILLVLAYLGILALVPYLTARKQFVVWHARQGLLLFGVSMVTLFSMILVNVVLWDVHWVLGLLFLLVLLTSSFGILALVVACILKAFEGERWRIPYLGDFVERV